MDASGAWVYSSHWWETLKRSDPAVALVPDVHTRRPADRR